MQCLWRGPLSWASHLFFKVTEYKNQEEISYKAKIFRESSWRKQNFIWVLKEYKDLQGGENIAIL